MDLALLVLRLVVGIFFAGHGAQKLWGVYGGHGLEGTGQFFETLGIKPGRTNAQIAGTSEFLGGILLVFGLLTPFAALAIISVMTVAIITVHAKNGPWVTESGYEYNAVLMAAAFVVAANPGAWSLDAALGLDGIHGTAFALLALVFGVAGGWGAVLAGRSDRGVLDTPVGTHAPVEADQPTEVQADPDREGRITREPVREPLSPREPLNPRDPR